MRHMLITILLVIVVFAILLFQFPADRRFTLFFINKTLGQSAVIFIGLSFLLGPLCKIFHFLSPHIHFRKYFGLFGFGIVVLHILTSLLQWQDRFNLKWYGDHIIGIIGAIVATIIFLVLAITSHNQLIRMLGGHRWKTVQRVGYVALILTLFHIFIVASARWQQWQAGKVDMPTNFLIFVFGIVVLVARLLALIVDKKRAATTIPV